jgi:hypothetical protein
VGRRHERPILSEAVRREHVRYRWRVLEGLLSLPAWISVSLAVVVLAGGLYLAHRLLNWLTRDRPKDYSRRGSAGLGNALLEVHSLLEPDRKSLLEARLEERVEERRSGDPPPA